MAQNPHGFVMTTDDISFLQRVLGVHGLYVLQTVLCYLCSGKAGASDSVKVGHYPTQISLWTGLGKRWCPIIVNPRHYIKISTLVHDFYISKRINIRILLVHDLQHTRLSQFNFRKVLFITMQLIFMGFADPFTPKLSSAISLPLQLFVCGFGLKSLFYQPWEWKNHSIIFLWLKIQG